MRQLKIQIDHCTGLWNLNSQQPIAGAFTVNLFLNLNAACSEPALILEMVKLSDKCFEVSQTGKLNSFWNITLKKYMIQDQY